MNLLTNLGNSLSKQNQSSEMVKLQGQIKHLQNMLSGMVITDEKA